jgi:hypothetical protein
MRVDGGTERPRQLGSGGRGVSRAIALQSVDHGHRLGVWRGGGEAQQAVGRPSHRRCERRLPHAHHDERPVAERAAASRRQAPSRRSRRTQRLRAAGPCPRLDQIWVSASQVSVGLPRRTTVPTPPPRSCGHGVRGAGPSSAEGILDQQLGDELVVTGGVNVVAARTHAEATLQSAPEAIRELEDGGRLPSLAADVGGEPLASCWTRRARSS